ncbi:MAG: AmmeMemoRadiSam system protein B, partial [Rhodobacteraceae bacterium]|nr:AmmeMemoRadiSam system protein B [Paracoccaceae bacterium]
MSHSTTETPGVRPAAVAGSFYPGSPAVLARDLRSLLAEAPPAAGFR